MFLCACSKDHKLVIKNGKREPVLFVRKDLAVSSGVPDVVFPQADGNLIWPQMHSNVRHVARPSVIASNIDMVWSYRLFKKKAFFIPNIVSDGENIYGCDLESYVFAVNASTGKSVWSLRFDDEMDCAGWVSLYKDAMYITTSKGSLVKIKDKKVVWKRDLGQPARSPAAIRSDKIIVQNTQNEVACYDLEGNKLWSNSGVQDISFFMGLATPAIDRDTALVSQTSGDLVAYDMRSGDQIWTADFIDPIKTDCLSSILQVRASPVIDNGIAYVIGHHNKISAIDLISGVSIWSKAIGSINTLNVVGDFIFCITNDAVLLAIHKSTGNIKWKKQLLYIDETIKRKRAINAWVGPVIGNNVLWVFSSLGYTQCYKAQDGTVLASFKSVPVLSYPICAKDKMYVLTHDGAINCYQNTKKS